MWVCPNSCGNGIIEIPEQCDSGRENNGRDGKCTFECKSLNPLCWNGKKEGKEECDLWENNGKYVNGTWCTVACTKFDPNKPECGDGDYDGWERCDTCAIDLWWACRWKCGDGVLNVNEECDNGEDNGHDGKCTFECKKVIDETKFCGNGKVEKWEECDNGVLNGKDWECSKECKNVKMEWKCWNGVVEEVGWEECDMWDNNGKEWVNCTKECKYKEKCGNGEKDEWETCKTCPQDLWDSCRPEPKEPECGDGNVDKWEDCNNCKEDLKDCIPTCGNGKYDKWETCDNCPEDLWVCPNSCGNGDKQEWEECDHWKDNWKDGKCSKDCKSLEHYCGNEKVEKWEECDNWKNNGIYTWEKSCTIDCTYFDPKNPNCGDGEVSDWEDCKCAMDLKNACMWVCGDEVLNVGEECDNGENNGKDGKCTFECKKVTDSTKYCGNNKVEKELWEECDMWENNGKDGKCTFECKNVVNNPKCGNRIKEWEEECDMWDNNGKQWVNCTKECKYDKKCGNGEKDEWETCKTCPEDLWGSCRPNQDKLKCGNGVRDAWEVCDPTDTSEKGWWNGWCDSSCKPITIDWMVCDSSYDGKRINNLTNSLSLCTKWTVIWFNYNAGAHKWTWSCQNTLWEKADCSATKPYCGDEIIDEWETCETCPQDVKNCNLCGNGRQDPWETCKTCPEDMWWCIQPNVVCNSCPCEYVDFAANLTRGDTIRAKLRDKQRSVFYNYSNSVAVENYLKFK